jgi:hypothetical protein
MGNMETMSAMANLPALPVVAAGSGPGGGLRT